MTAAGFSTAGCNPRLLLTRSHRLYLDVCLRYCCGSILPTDVAWASAQMHNRTDTRERYGIRGNAHRIASLAPRWVAARVRTHRNAAECREIELEEDSFRK
jgi:hypothetical protein